MRNILYRDDMGIIFPSSLRTPSNVTGNSILIFSHHLIAGLHVPITDPESERFFALHHCRLLQVAQVGETLIIEVGKIQQVGLRAPKHRSLKLFPNLALLSAERCPRPTKMGSTGAPTSGECWTWMSCNPDNTIRCSA